MPAYVGNEWKADIGSKIFAGLSDEGSRANNKDGAFPPSGLSSPNRCAYA